MHSFRVRLRSALAAAVTSALVTWGTGGAQAADRFVTTSGTDASNDCLSNVAPCATVAHALASATSGDTIKIAAGTFPANLAVASPTTLTLSGGWAADFSGQDPANATTLDGGKLGSVLVVTASGISIDLAFDHMTIQKGSGVEGGAIRAESIGTGALALAFTDAAVTKNKTQNIGGNGGAIFAFARDSSTIALTLTRVTLSKNKARSGGGIWASIGDSTASVSVTLTSCDVSKNKALDFGGAIGGSGADLTLDRTAFVKNVARSNEGGAIALLGSSNTLTAANTTYARNRATFGGAIGTEGSVVHLSNCTVTANIAKNPACPGCPLGGGLRLRGSSVELTDNIIWGNKVTSGSPDIVVLSSSGTASHNDNPELASGIPSITNGGGNIDADPAFVSRKDLHLTAASPCVDTGTCTGAPATDFEGDARPAGADCDMGADEFVP